MTPGEFSAVSALQGYLPWFVTSWQKQHFSQQWMPNVTKLFIGLI